MQVPKRHAANCKWAKPTLDEPGPTWLEANERPWTCEREGVLRPLESTEACEDCPHWEEATDEPPTS
jgi:hypothetical protein